MSLVKILFWFLFLDLVNSELQINLYLTDDKSENNDLQHDCLHITAYIHKKNDPYQIISFCMGELSSKFNIKQNNIDQKLTFSQLSKQHITSQELFSWSAPIDLIEDYQSYLLNELNNSMSTKIFYNCTLPFFGPECQYVLNDYKSHHTSLDHFIHDYYRYNIYEPVLYTCYIHLECNRGPSPSCLDWTEICDGRVDCLNDGYDEKDCWQLELHQCDENEYQCSNGQCIPKSFVYDDQSFPDCLDISDENHGLSFKFYEDSLFTAEPIFRFEDISCVKHNRGSVYSDQFLTSSCIPNREKLLTQAMFSIKPNGLSDECWTATKSIIMMPIVFSIIDEVLCDTGVCDEIIQNTCPDIIYIPAVPILIGHVYLVYNKTKLIYDDVSSPEPSYVCYDEQLLYVPDDNKTLSLFNNDTCRLYNDSSDASLLSAWYKSMNAYVSLVNHWLTRNTSSIHNNSGFCDKSITYQCMNSSKCISKSRLLDNVIDCLYNDDEELFLDIESCSLQHNFKVFKCETTNECIPYHFVQDGTCHCTMYDDYCDDEYPDISRNRNSMSFQTICDGFLHLLPKLKENLNETDETNCEEWPLLHIYNRCDGFWHFLNGSDEINCDSTPLLNCSDNHHICVSKETNELMCLPIEKANDGIIDCLGAADEPTLCRMNISLYNFQTFHCQSAYQPDQYCIEWFRICGRFSSCKDGEDIRACKTSDIVKFDGFGGVCRIDYELHGSDNIKVLCRHFVNTGQRWTVYFTLDRIHNPVELNMYYGRVPLRRSIDITYFHLSKQRCHRGLELQIWLDKEKNLTTDTCLCPSSFYGDTCQYQNQRVSLTLEIRIPFDSIHIPFIIIISLIDDSNEQIIHSYQQFTYLSTKYCQRKFNFYLLYSSRPKDPTKNYSINIDIYEKITLNYRGNIMKSLSFPFLPVHRVVFQMDIPQIIDNMESCSDHSCINGKCIKHSNDPNRKPFCQCKKGWAGRSCTIQHTSMCSSDSLCLGKLANNRSLCICPSNKMGSRCLLDNPICQINKDKTCYNGGLCIPLDEYGTLKKNFTCICPKGYIGDRCEIIETKLVVSFNKNIVFPSFVLIHFIEVKPDDYPVRTTTFKTIPLRLNSITIHWSLPFHLVFIDLSNENYYLTVIQKTYIQSVTINKTLNPSDRCPHTNELFHETFANYSLLRRVKYYHLLCKTNSSLLCFYDEYHLCLCQQFNQERVANCFQFDHNMNMNCSGRSSCQNKGRCFQEYSICPKLLACACPTCYYGPHCEFSTNVFSLSLDNILGFHIRPHISISKQPSAVLISSILSTFLIIIGLVNGILSLITFKNKKTRESGCGIYLLCSSIITLLTMIIFTLKFWILIVSQMGLITNRSFLKIQCISIDFFLRFCLTMDQWLTAFVAIERAYVAIKGISFQQKKMIKIAKWTIFILVFGTILTNIHDPIYRQLFDEDNDEEKRIWCTVNYPFAVRIFNIIINLSHFIISFIINLTSAAIIIIIKIRKRRTIQTQQKLKEILYEQIQQHKNLLLGPCVLVILGIPRLIMSFTSGCMKSASDSWLFLLGYFISLIPSTLTFILFVLPSTAYKQEFSKAISRYRHMITRHL